MEKINGNKIVKFIYDTGYEKIEAETRDKATTKFENWINNNTPYRGLGMFAKHKGYDLVFEDDCGNQYMRNGMKIYRVDQYGNLMEEVNSN